MESRSVVIVEDDADIRGVLGEIFKAAGFQTYSFAAGLAGVEGVRTYRPQVVLLDLGLPDIDGFEVSRRIRLFSNAYILMLTARTQELDTVLGLEAGADDFLTKPFSRRELRSRVEALLRRPRLRSDTNNLTGSPLEAAPVTPGSVTGEVVAAADKDVFEHNGLRLNLPARTVHVDGTERNLTVTEFDLLHLLLRGGRKAHAKEDLAGVLRGGIAVAGGLGWGSDDQAIQAHVANLRRKLGDVAAEPRWVETVHGFGYRLAAAAVAGASPATLPEGV